MLYSDVYFDLFYVDEWNLLLEAQFIEFIVTHSYF